MLTDLPHGGGVCAHVLFATRLGAPPFVCSNGIGPVRRLFFPQAKPATERTWGFAGAIAVLVCAKAAKLAQLEVALLGLVETSWLASSCEAAHPIRIAGHSFLAEFAAIQHSTPAPISSARAKGALQRQTPQIWGFKCWDRAKTDKHLENRRITAVLMV